MVNKEFFQALEMLEREKKIPQNVFIETLENALALAYKKHYGVAKAIEVRLNPEKSTIRIIAYRNVVEETDDPDTQISLEEAKLINKKYKVGDVIWEEVSSKDFGRIVAQNAKQVIMQRLREVESEVAYKELAEKEDELVTCVVRRVDGKNVYVELKKLEAVLLPADQLPNDKFHVGERIKVYVKKIKQGTRGPQVQVSRTAPEFVKKLFEMEVPEIKSGQISVQGIVREPGYRTKMAVYSDDPNIDAVGAFVGNRGMRVNSVVSELGGEKIEIIPWCEDQLEFIARALSPAKVIMVEANDDSKSATVIVADDMLSLAIGREGQNARLAARLTGWKIDVRPYSSIRERVEDSLDEESEEAYEAEDASVFDESMDDGLDAIEIDEAEPELDAAAPNETDVPDENEG